MKRTNFFHRSKIRVTVLRDNTLVKILFSVVETLLSWTSSKVVIQPVYRCNAASLRKNQVQCCCWFRSGESVSAVQYKSDLCVLVFDVSTVCICIAWLFYFWYLYCMTSVFFLFLPHACMRHDLYMFCICITWLLYVGICIA